jgi:gliding motility-associated-like protein
MRYFFPILLILSTPVLAQLNADFSASVIQGCSPLTVQFKDNSTGSPTSWFWDFGNGITSFEQNPNITYTTGGNYTVRLIVRNASEEDYEEKTNYIKVFKTPLAGFVTNKDSGCIPLLISFNDTTNLSGVTVKSFFWDFGDGTTSPSQNPTHSYVTDDKFAVSFTITTTDGCTDTFVKRPIAAGNKPTADFTASPLDGCNSVLRKFINRSARVTGSLWDFGDQTTSIERSPLHHFKDTGWLSVRLVVSENGCKDTAVKKDYIHISGPIAKINRVVDCDNRFSVQFRDVSTGSGTTNWDFGDGNTSTLKTVDHIYAAIGQYTVVLRVDNGVCFDTSNITVYINSIEPAIDVFPKKALYCRGDSIRFMFTNYDTASASAFRWNFGNGDSLLYNETHDTVNYVYPGNGNFNPVGFFRDKNRCFDTIPLNPAIKIAGPTADFKISDTACSGSTTVFYDKSNNNGQPIKEWLWNYGDGTMLKDTVPFTYNYPFPGDYNVNLTVTDVNGCIDTITHIITIAKTPEVIAGPDIISCAVGTYTLSASGAAQYNWQTNNNVICNNCTSPVVSPSATSVYYVTGIDPTYCSAVDSTIITVQSQQDITVDPVNTAICLGGSVQLNATGMNIYSWLPATGLSNPAVGNPVATPTLSTVYTVIGKDSNNCFSDTATATVTVNPLPVVDIATSSIQLPVGSTYQLPVTASPDVQTWQWLPKTGLSCYTCANPVATVNKTITYKATVYNANGCSNTDTIQIIAICSNEVIFLPNTFSPNNDGMNDYFFPNSKSVITIKFLKIYNRWGLEVFQRSNFFSNNSNSGWNGKYNNTDLNPDVYIYVIQFQCGNDKIVTLKGNVTLLR